MSRSLCCFMVLVLARLHLGNSARTSWPGILQRGQELPLWFASIDRFLPYSIGSFRGLWCDQPISDAVLVLQVIVSLSLFKNGFWRILLLGMDSVVSIYLYASADYSR